MTAFLARVFHRLWLAWRRWRDRRALRHQFGDDSSPTPVVVDRPSIRQKDVMHWCPDQSGYPFCGASRKEPWTPDFEFATCKLCVEKGRTVYLQHKANFR
jgi:hypothetical protein